MEAVAQNTAVKVTPRIPESITDGPKTKFWVGVTNEAPFHAVTNAGVRFTRQLGKLDQDENKAPVYTGRRGQIVALTDKQVDLVREVVAKKVVRPMGRSAQIFVIGAANYSPYPKDVPLGAYLYMHRLGETAPVGWMDSDPETMWTPGEGEKALVTAAAETKRQAEKKKAESDAFFGND